MLASLLAGLQIGAWFGSHPWLPWTVFTGVSLLCVLAAAKLLPWAVIASKLRSPDSLPRVVWIWVLGSLLAYGITMAAFYLAQALRVQERPHAEMVFSIFWAISIAVLILLLIPYLPVKPAYGYLAGIGGGVLGWLLGMYISPEGTSEQQQFAKIGTAIFALFSGYTLKSVWDWLRDRAGEGGRVYCGILALSAAVGMAAVYNTRAYGIREVRISFPEFKADAKDSERIVVPKPANVRFLAAVTGVPDTAVEWAVISGADETKKAAVANGHFTAGEAGVYRVQAQSTYDHRLVDVVEVEVK